MSVDRKIIVSPNVSKSSSPNSPAVQVDGTLYISGQLGVNLKGELVAGIAGQTRQALNNLGHILKAAGTDYRNVVRVNILLSDMNNFSRMNSIYSQYFIYNFPARTCCEVAVLPRNALIEIEAVAEVGNFLESKL